jgi:hypothetical protein
VAADLGTWPAEQATVLLEVLHTAGLHPEARRGRDGVHVTVPDAEGDRAHATLVAQMDTIAKAARPGGSSRGGRRLRAVEDPPGAGAKRKGAARKSGKSRRDQRTSGGSGGRRTGGGSRRLGQPAALIGAGFLVAVVLGPPTATFVLAVSFGAAVWLLGRRSDGGI